MSDRVERSQLWWALSGQMGCLRRCRIFTLVLLSGVLFTSTARTQPKHDLDPVVILLQGADAERAVVIAALKDELKTEVSEAPTDAPHTEVKVELSETTVRATRVRATGETLTRTIARPAQDDELVQVMVWLVSNLVRDEAAEILAELGPPPTAEAMPAEPEATPAEPAEPPPTEPTAKPPPAALTAETKAATERTKASSDEALEPRPELPRSVVQLSLVHPVSLFPDGRERDFLFAHSLFYGDVGGVRAFGLDLIGGRIGATSGGYLAGIWSRRTHQLMGARVVGVASWDAGKGGRGVDVAGIGLVDLGEGRFEGVRVGGAVQWNQAALYGVAIGGALSTSQQLRGVSLGGAVNLVGSAEQQPSRGAAIAGAVNVARDFKGIMASGGLNVARDIDGVQVGLINVGRKVRGAQVGLVNVTNDLEGPAVGIVNLVDRGEIQAVVSGGSYAAVNAGVRFVVPPIVSEVSMGLRADASDGRGRVVLPELSVGGRIPLSPLYIDLDAAWALGLDDDEPMPTQSVRLRPTLGWDISPSIGVFAGAGVRIFPDDSKTEPEIGGGFTFF